MKQLSRIFFVLMVFVLANLAGCQNSPGGVFSPSADLFLAKVEPPFLQPKASEDEEVDGQTALVFTPLEVSFNVSNGVSCFLNSYVVRYYTTDGKALNGGKFDRSGAMSLFVSAPPMTWEEKKESGEEEDTAVADDKTAVDIFSPALYSYMSKGNSIVTDDISPVIARVEFSGRDVNDRNVTAVTQVDLITTLQEDDDSE